MITHDGIPLREILADVAAEMDSADDERLDGALALLRRSEVDATWTREALRMISDWRGAHPIKARDCNCRGL